MGGGGEEASLVSTQTQIRDPKKSFLFWGNFYRVITVLALVSLQNKHVKRVKIKGQPALDLTRPFL